MVFYLEIDELDEMNFNKFFELFLIVNDSSSPDFYPKKIIFILSNFFDIENLFVYYENFKNKLKELWRMFLEKV